MKNEVLPKEFRRQALEQLWMMNFGRFGRLRRRDREYMVCRLHGRPGGNIKPRWGIKRQPMRLLIGTCRQNMFLVFNLSRVWLGGQVSSKTIVLLAK